MDELGLLVPHADEFDKQYVATFHNNFMKPNLNLTALNSTATLTKLQRKAGANSTTFKLTMTMPENDVHIVRDLLRCHC